MTETFGLEKYSMEELRKICKEMELLPKKTKAGMIEEISTAFNEYEKFKRKKIDKYKKHKIIGQGKEGTTYLVTDGKNREFAMKTFRSTKSINRMENEIVLQKIASKAGIAPKIFTVDKVEKFFVMEKMDSHLTEEIKKKGLSLKWQKEILAVLEKLDNIKVFHNDANLSNFMLKDGKIFMIDYGFAKAITPELVKKLKTETPNVTLMTVGLVLKLRELGVSEKSFSYILKRMPEKYRLKLNGK